MLWTSLPLKDPCLCCKTFHSGLKNHSNQKLVQYLVSILTVEKTWCLKNIRTEQLYCYNSLQHNFCNYHSQLEYLLIQTFLFFNIFSCHHWLFAQRTCPVSQFSFTLDKGSQPFTLNMVTASFIWWHCSSYSGEDRKAVNNWYIFILSMAPTSEIRIITPTGKKARNQIEIMNCLLSWHACWETWHAAFPDCFLNLIWVKNVYTEVKYPNIYISFLSLSERCFR